MWVENKVWIDPEPFYAIRYINDVTYLPGDINLKIESVYKPGENNGQFLQTRSPSSFKDISSYKILSFQALRNAALGEELQAHHENKYECYGSGGA